jgi:hypothetical protein
MKEIKLSECKWPQVYVFVDKQLNNNKMTAVEWLYNHLFPKQLDGFSDEEWSKIDLAFKQAKEMEKELQKEKLKDAYDAGVWDVGCRAPNFDEYYKRTFKSE